MCLRLLVAPFCPYNNALRLATTLVYFYGLVLTPSNLVFSAEQFTLAIGTRRLYV